MKHIKSYALHEAKQVGVLYHYTSINFLFNILETNKLINRSRHIRTVCFTRNKYFHMDAGDMVQVEARLVIDGDKLSEKYKVYPYAETLGMRNTWKGLPSNQGSGYLEFEERVDATIENLSSYILGIEIDEYIFVDLSPYIFEKFKAYGYEVRPFEKAYTTVHNGE